MSSKYTSFTYTNLLNMKKVLLKPDPLLLEEIDQLQVKGGFADPLAAKFICSQTFCEGGNCVAGCSCSYIDDNCKVDATYQTTDCHKKP